MPDLNEATPFGDYLPKELLGETPTTRTWLAEQASVGRLVLIEELKPGATSQKDSFLADVRAKASVEHPLVSSVYEASAKDDHVFFAEELLPGKNLQQRAMAGERIKPQRLVHHLRRVAEANIHHETHDHSTSPLGPDSIYLDDHGVVRLKNLAIAGPRLPDESLRDTITLGKTLPEITSQNSPGATRCLTLFAWMCGEGTSKPLSWEQIRDYCEELEQQLTEPTHLTAPPTAAIRPSKKSPAGWLAAVILALIIAVALAAFSKRPAKPITNAILPEPVSIPAGSHTAPDGSSFTVSPFSISAHEVTIGQYAEFLATLEHLSAENHHTTFDHPEQPTTKTDHLPDDWQNLLAAARARTTWNNRPVSLQHPVVGIDWWDASAYATWKRARLPTIEQWLAALLHHTPKPSEIPVSEWIPVTSETLDRTTNGILAMAGSVSEWTLETRPNPANPLGESFHITLGGSFLNPAKGALTRDYLADPSTRRPDLGFRTVAAD